MWVNTRVHLELESPGNGKFATSYYYAGMNEESTYAGRLVSVRPNIMSLSPVVDHRIIRFVSELHTHIQQRIMS